MGSAMPIGIARPSVDHRGEPMANVLRQSIRSHHARTRQGASTMAIWVQVICSNSEPDGSMTGHSWITDDGIMVKMESQVSADGQVEAIGFLLTNVQRGDQDPSLFELPVGLQVMKMPAMPTQ